MRVIAAFLTFATLSGAQGLEYVKANYTKYEYEIPMRDGKKLFTSVYLPKDLDQKYPILLNRTPYTVSPYGSDNYKTDLGPNAEFAKQGFIVVYQDVRGRNMSEGEFVNMTPHKPVKRGPRDIDESTDTYDTIEWLIQNLPNNNGRVGQWGISYPGFYTAAGMIDAHPALKASSPQAPISDWFVGDDFHHNGTLYLPHAFRFFNGFGRPRPAPTRPPANRPADVLGTDGYRFFLDMGPLANANEKFFKNDVAFWNDIAKHPNYDAFWQERNLRPHIKNVKHAVMTVGGWFDAENLFGALKVYENNEKNSPGGFNMLVMGPWFHGGWARGDGDFLGHVKFGSKTALYYREKIELPFFNFYLKDKADPKLPEAYVFETGTNVWRKEDKWPPTNMRQATLHFHANGKLNFDAATAAGNDEYISDPAKPVPFINGQAPGMTREHMVEDQRFASTRTDVLTYQTEALSADLTIAGPLTPKLFVSTSGTDSDFVVKIVDVYPDDYPDPDPNPTGIRMAGYQQLIRGEVFRARFRKSFEKPEAMTPGKVEIIEYTMPDIYHTFRKGHRIMIQVQSSWFPLADRNPQKFIDNIFDAKQSDFVKATQRVYFGGAQASGVKVLVRP